MPLKLSPSVMAFTLVGLLSCSTTIFILIPPNLQGSRGVDNEGYFGRLPFDNGLSKISIRAWVPTLNDGFKYFDSALVNND